MKEIKIWNSDIKSINTYVDFISSFELVNNEKVTLNISCDSIFSVYVNKRLAGFGSCQNFKNDFYYYSFDITNLCDKKNDLSITVWHLGEDTQTYIVNDAFLMFNIIQGDKKLLKSDNNILSRVNTNYQNGLIKKITPQLGFSYKYDFTVSNDNKFTNSTEYGHGEAKQHGVKNLELLELADYEIIETPDSYIIDLKKETVGYLEFDIDSRCQKEITISFGEWLKDGHVPRLIGYRDFSLEFILKEGNNKFANYLRRIAGRFLEVDKKDITINLLTLRIVEYPQEEIPKTFSDPLIQQIYDTAVYTLKCCMHEHYEDCPWREQALYNMDSRNQMLCGYFAFKGTDYQRANLVMMTKGMLDNGLLNICFPSGVELPIPSFNLVYIIQVYEYIKYSRDTGILNDVGNTIKTIVNTFKNQIDETGLIASFPYPCWNFYEWSEGSANGHEITRRKQDKYVKTYDLILNALYVYVMKMYDEMFNEATDLSFMKQAIKRNFYNHEAGLYKLSDSNNKHSVLGNSLVLLAGLGDKALAEKLVKGGNLIPVTLSMCTFFYDALLETDSSYEEFIINDIKTKYSQMLASGATTFWETELGAADFGGAGSLCHGWSAMPVYYFHKLNLK